MYSWGLTVVFVLTDLETPDYIFRCKSDATLVVVLIICLRNEWGVKVSDYAGGGTYLPRDRAVIV